MDIFSNLVLHNSCTAVIIHIIGATFNIQITHDLLPVVPIAQLVEFQEPWVQIC